MNTGPDHGLGPTGAAPKTPMTPADWLVANESKRARLYQVCRAVMTVSGLSLTDLLAKALARTDHVGTDYERNMRSGRIARSKAAQLYQWIAAHHLALAQRTAPDLFGAQVPVLSTALAAWHRVLATKAQRGSFAVAPLHTTKRQFAIIRRADTNAPPLTLRLGAAFQFWTAFEAAGHGLFVQMSGPDQHPHALNIVGADDGAFVMPIGAGPQPLPPDQNGTPVSFTEQDSAGLHRFVLLHSTRLEPLMALCADWQDGAPLTAAALSALMHAGTADQVAVHVADVIFTST